MKRILTSNCAYIFTRALSVLLITIGALMVLIGFASYPGANVLAQGSGVEVISSYSNDLSAPLSSMPQAPPQSNPAPMVRPVPNDHTDSLDPVVQDTLSSLLGITAPTIPTTNLNFDGVSAGQSFCNCEPPDPNGAVGKTQYVQIVNTAYEVFDKATGNSVLGPNGISSVWRGFGGVCEANGSGDPIVLYDHLADRWIISQFAGVNYPTDECVAVSTSSDATGTYYRYGFHLGSNFVDYPKLGVWPDAYYMTMNIFDSSGSTFLGPKPYAFDRASMLTGAPAIVISTGRLASTEYSLLPADLDGSTLPPAGAPNSFLEFPGQSTPKYKIYHFHVDFITPANSTFINFASPLAAGFNAVCASSCVPQAGTSSLLDALGDRLMFRLAYRNFGDHESLLANYSVKHNAVAGVRWVELRNVTAGPVSVFQESTYQPDSTWRWMGSAAMDKRGNLVIGYSASSASISPQIRYAGRLATDPVNTLSQGEAHLFDGGGSQTPGTRWGDYTAMSIDPIDDTTFWYTNEYYSVTSDFNWRTRIGSFRFPGIISAVSRKLHGSAGTFDLDLPVTGTRGVECRSGGSGGNYQIILTSANNLTAVGNVSVSCGSVSSSSIGPNPNQYTVNLTGENSCDGQYLTINLTGVADSSGAVFNASQTFGLLLGDTTANGVVNSSDIAQTQSQSGQTVTAFNFREDVTVNGIINSSDIALVQSESGTGLPTPP